MIHYPDGKKYQNKSRKTINPQLTNTANRGRALEEALILSNNFYKEKNLALIYKRPTPIRVVKVDYSRGPKIIDAYFEKESTTDFNGVFKGKYIDIEAKSTLSRTSFPFHNISKHQINHLENVIRNGGFAFFIISFRSYDEVYLLNASFIIDQYNNIKVRSLPYKLIKEKGHLIEQKLYPPLDYLPQIENNYF